MSNNNYRICTRCIMDTTEVDIEFDANGICNHCRRYDEVASKDLFSGQEGRAKLQKIANEIKEYGKIKSMIVSLASVGEQTVLFLLIMLKNWACER